MIEFLVDTNVISELFKPLPNPLVTTWLSSQNIIGISVIPVSDAQAYRQFGNSVIVPVVEAILKQIKITVEKYNLGQSRQKQLSLF